MITDGHVYAIETHEYIPLTLVHYNDKCWLCGEDAEDSIHEV